MTSEDKKRFESQWPATAARLHKMLARRGVPLDRRDDIVQETGLRLLGSWDRVDAARPLWPLTVTIALNLLRDQARKGLDSEVPYEFLERPDALDVEALGLARLELKRAGMALAQMAPGQRNVLLAEVDPSRYEPASSTPAATKMLRMRARRKLSVLMQQVSALCVAPVAAIRRLARIGHLAPFSRATEGAVTSALCGVLCVVALGGAVSLAPFSAVPGTSDDLAHIPSFEQGHEASATVTAMTTAASVAQERRSIRDVAGVAGSGDAGTDPGGHRPGRADDEEGAFEHGGSYEIPVGGKPFAEGKVLVQVFDGGSGSVPTSFDCSEHMFSPDEIDATCWDQRDPQRKYGIRVKHEGKTRLDELEVSGT